MGRIGESSPVPLDWIRDRWRASLNERGGSLMDERLDWLAYTYDRSGSMQPVMTREVKLRDVETVLAEFEFPTDRDTVAAACGDVTLLLAEGEENLGGIIAGSSADGFESVNDLATEVMNLLPQHAVGEPYQSEGDA